MASSSENQSVNPPRSALIKVMIGLLVAWLILLIIDIPISGYVIAQQQGVASAVGPVAIEAVFVALLVLFLSYGLRGRTWSFAGATGIDVAHTILSVCWCTWRPGKPPGSGSVAHWCARRSGSHRGRSNAD
jgi:ABC-type methionine transport system permease subunit